MSIYKDGKLIAGGRQCMPLLSFMWADHVLNDASWLRADTFSWQSGAVYQAVYQHLVDDYDNGPLESETINGQLIYFHRAPDGHKVVIVYDDDTHHKAVETIYNSTGVAWYYIIDTTNQRFKLPRTKFGFTGLRDTAGKYVAAGLPNITGTLAASWGSNSSDTGAFRHEGDDPNSSFGGDGSWNNSSWASFDASRSSSIYGNSDTVQPKATQMYLYFYVGNFTQTALENTAGVVTEDFNELNAHKVIAFQTPTAANNYTWYRKYADGWVEQGGIKTIPSRTNAGDSSTTVTFPIPMGDTNYTGQISYQNGGAYFANCTLTFSNRQTTGANLVFYMNTSGTTAAFLVGWQVSGMAAN